MGSHTKADSWGLCLEISFGCDLHYNRLFASQLSPRINGLLLVSARPVPSFPGFCEFSIAEQIRRNYSRRLDNEDGVLGREKGPLSSTFVARNGPAKPAMQQDTE